MATTTLEGWRTCLANMRTMVPYPSFPANNAKAVNVVVDVEFRLTLELTQHWFQLRHAKQRAHQMVDEQIDRAFYAATNATDAGACYASMDLERDLRYAVQYLFEGRKFSELATTPGAYREQTVVSRSIGALLRTLRLQRKRGRPPAKANGESVS
jgi:hypothetical protein